MLNKITPPSTPVLIEDLGSMFPKITSPKKKRYGLFKCQCGNEFKTQINSVIRGSTKSCGCLSPLVNKINNTTHGSRSHPIYNAWSAMIQRCTNSNHLSFINYGGRGITVCERWLDSFENFRDDMFPTWEEGLSLDRINVNGNYEPSNCRLATRTTQQRNRRMQSNNTSGYIGAYLDARNNKWRSMIGICGKSKWLGYYKTALEAAKAYDTYVIENNLEHTINGVLISPYQFIAK